MSSTCAEHWRERTRRGLPSPGTPWTGARSPRRTASPALLSKLKVEKRRGNTQCCGSFCCHWNKICYQIIDKSFNILKKSPFWQKFFFEFLINSKDSDPGGQLRCSDPGGQLMCTDPPDPDPHTLTSQTLNTDVMLLPSKNSPTKVQLVFGEWDEQMKLSPLYSRKVLINISEYWKLVMAGNYKIGPFQLAKKQKCNKIWLADLCFPRFIRIWKK